MIVSLDEWRESTLPVGYIQDGELLGSPIIRCACGEIPRYGSIDTTDTADARVFGPRRKFKIVCKCGNATTTWASSTNTEAIEGAVAEWNLAYGLEIEQEDLEPWGKDLLGRLKELK